MTERPRIDFPSRIGVWWGAMSWPMPAAQEVAREIEALGYGSLFIPEVGLKDCLVESAALLDATEKLVIGTGIANIHARLPTAAEGGGRTLTALHPGRFVLGLGVSHGPLVENMFGLSYDKPLATMRTYLERMAALPDFIEPGVGRPTRLLAALGPKMIELSGTMADGAHPYLVSPEQTATTREILGPDKWVVSEQAVVVGEDAEEQLRRAHLHLEVYSGLPNYRNSWLRQGFDTGEAVPVAAVGGTPTFFINGQRLGGAYPLEGFQEIIDAELAKSTMNFEGCDEKICGCGRQYWRWKIHPRGDALCPHGLGAVLRAGGDSAETLHRQQMGRGDIGNHADGRGGNLRQAGNLPPFTHPHLQNRPLFRGGELKKGEGEADQIIEVAGRLQAGGGARQDRGEHLFGRRFAGRAGDGGDRQVKTVAPEGGKITERTQGVGDDNLRKRLFR